MSGEAAALYDTWIADGCHGDMAYMERYGEVRADPVLLLDGARTIFMSAFSYANPDAVRDMESRHVPLISEYALGDDYHTEVRERLSAAAQAITERYGGVTRVCVDTAPLRERYWARQAGLGFIGVNNYLIIPGMGLHFVLGAILWTGEADVYDTPCTGSCGACGRCVDACPTGAISSDGRLDARKCLSYLTIESREPLPDGVSVGQRLFGCDTCRRACPHEPANPQTTDIAAFRARPDVMALSRRDWLSMTPEKFSLIFRNSAVKRAKLPKLLATLHLQK